MIYCFLVFFLSLIHTIYCQLGGYPPLGYGYNSPYISPYSMRMGSYEATNGLGYGYSQPFGYGMIPSQSYGYGMTPYYNPYDMNGGYESYGSSRGRGRMSSFIGGAMEGVMLGATLGMAG